MTARKHKPYHRRYHGDALGGYRKLSLELRGAYTTLLDEMYDHGGPVEERFVCAWLGCDPRVWRRLRHELINVHRKILAYEDADGVVWLLQERVQSELGLPNYAELVAKIGRKYPIAVADVTDSYRGVGGKTATKTTAELSENTGKLPLVHARSPLPIPEERLSDADASSPVKPRLPGSPPVTQNDVDTIWRETPAKGRERSGRGDLEKALRAAAKRGHPPSAIRPALKRYYASEEATRSDGQFAKGVHRLVEMDRWQTWAESAPRLPSAEWTPERWRAALENFGESGRWSGDWGPKPTEPGCRAPAQVLADLGFSPREGGNVRPFDRSAA